MNAGSLGMVGLMAANSGLPAEEGASKKIRKPYTITKSRESWTEQEHDKFLEALQLFDRDWKKIEAFVGSKTVIQIRSHAQKYFLKVQKNGTGEHVPPPRPKRKSAQPYPQKAAKIAPAQPNSRGLTVPHPAAADYGYMLGPQQCNLYVPAVSAAVSPWVHHVVPPAFNFKDGQQPELATPNGVKNQSLASIGSSPCTWQQQVPAQDNIERAAPAFSEVYRFIGSIFDPEVTGHLKRLRDMAPIDKETVLLLMRNLTINLSSPEFDEQKFSVPEYDFNPRDDKSSLATSKADGNEMQAAGLRSNEAAAAETTTTSTAAAAIEAVTDGRFSDDPRESRILPGIAATADVSKHQRHPYDGGGLVVVQDSDELDYISEVLEGSQMDLSFTTSEEQQQLGVSSTADDESYELAVETRLLSAGEDESVDRWWRP